MLLILRVSLLILASIFMLSGCKTIEITGQYIDNDTVKQLEGKALTKQEVIEITGTPTIIPDYSPNTWYYVERSIEKKSWFSSKVIEQRIVKVTFNDKEKLESVTILDNSNKEDLKLASDHTKTYGTEQNPVQQFVRNIGRFNKGSKKTKRSTK